MPIRIIIIRIRRATSLTTAPGPNGNASLLEFSVDWTLDDFPHYAHNRDLGYRMPISSPQRAMEVFRSEFDAAWEFGALWISVGHPAFS
jgi:hypothetical protein